MRPLARLRAPRTTRLVRFGYRRPPPWPRTVTPELAPQAIVPPSSWRKLENVQVQLKPIQSPSDAPIPTLAHGLQPVLRGDGLYPLEAPWSTRGRQLLYADSLRRITPPERIAWHAMAPYVPAGQDQVLKQVAKQCGAKYFTSTSSITGVIGLLYHLISHFRETELIGGLSEEMREMPGGFAKMHRKPIAVIVKDGGVSNHGNEGGSVSILRDLGQSMERMLTMEQAEFKRRYVKGEGEDEQSVFRYSLVGDVLVRAQIDCLNDATGEVFDVKTRGIAPIRYDLGNWFRWRGKRVGKLKGRWDSYEREFYDMVRSVFLKYALQLKLGRMHGALIAYHNTAEILGLEYVALGEIESYVFGNQEWANVAVGCAFEILQEILKVVGEGKVVFCNEWSSLKMFVFVQDMQQGDIFGKDRFETQVNEVILGKDGGEIFHRDKGAVSIVGGGEVALLGGNKVGSEAVRRKRRVALDSRDFNQEEVKKVLKVWELDVLPTVNGNLLSKGVGKVRKGDDFRLYWDLKQVKVRKTHVMRFLESLSRIYDSS